MYIDQLFNRNDWKAIKKVICVTFNAHFGSSTGARSVSKGHWNVFPYTPNFLEEEKLRIHKVQKAKFLLQNIHRGC